MNTAVLIDGAFLRKKFHAAYKKDITAENINKFANSLLTHFNLPLNELHRIYYYDCSPCTAKSSLPVTNRAFLFEKTPQFSYGKQLLSDIKKLNFFAVREGTLQFSGWKLKKTAYNKQPLTDDDFEPELHQKGVDIKIGLDLAWISFNHIAERVIFVTGDSDFIPAIKTARRNGIFIYLATLNHMVRPELPDNCDLSLSDSIKIFNCI
ncbi:NYN domain-containing protein [uncultured Treponema sp.]|uniref:NYN domain-containing protein n=1 Tax=uncultured Treponema sp. TaxID=162155 RepID=UPI0025FAD0FB|nr:NYN domain-containing protein [uncultured Treponema sp.]